MRIRKSQEENSMKFNNQLAIAITCLLGSSNYLWAQSAPDSKPSAQAAAAFVLPPGITEDMLAPPPVPRFMLEKPASPLTMDEMVQQARDAEMKAGAAQKSASTPAGKASKSSN